MLREEYKTETDRKVISVGLHQVKNLYTPRYNVIDLSVVAEKLVQDKPTSPRAPLPTSITARAAVQSATAAYSPRAPVKRDVDKEVITGFVVGRQNLDENQIAQEKKRVQRQHLAQLNADLELNIRLQEEEIALDEAERALLHSARHKPHPARHRGGESEEEKGDGAVIGAYDFGGQETELQMQIRARQRYVLESNIKESEDRRLIKRTPSTQPKIVNPTQHLEVLKIAEADFCIGNSQPKEALKKQKEEERKKFLEQLDRDEEVRSKLQQEQADDSGSVGRGGLKAPSAVGYARRTPRAASPSSSSSREKKPMFTPTGEYINRTGWGGLNVGGTATGNTASQALLHEKESRQERYRLELDEQVRLNAQLQSESRQRDRSEAIPSATVPYMQYKQ